MAENLEKIFLPYSYHILTIFLPLNKNIKQPEKIINKSENTYFWKTNDSEDDSSETTILKFRFRTFDFEYFILKVDFENKHNVT